MALPVASSPAGIPADYCCDTLSKIADRIRTVATDGLCSCLEASCADREFRSYVTVGDRVEDPLGDSLIVHMLRTQPTPGSRNGLGQLMRVGTYDSEFRVQLLETGWQMLDSNEMTQAIYAPDFEMVNALSLHAMGHGEKMYRALLDSIQRKEMFVGPDNGHIGEIGISPLVPVNPTAYLVGFSCTVTVQAVFR